MRLDFSQGVIAIKLKMRCPGGLWSRILIIRLLLTLSVLYMSTFSQVSLNNDVLEVEVEGLIAQMASWLR